MPARILRRDPPHATGPPRAAVGISVASSCQTVRAALIEAAGRGLATRVAIRAAISLPVADTLVARLRKLVAGTKSEIPIDTFGQLRAELAEIEVESIQKLHAEAAVPLAKTLVIGLDDPGLWSGGPGAC